MIKLLKVIELFSIKQAVKRRNIYLLKRIYSLQDNSYCEIYMPANMYLLMTV
jgi:hypothetical protein